MFTQADLEERQCMLLDEKLDYRRFDAAVEKKDGVHIGHNGNQRKKKILMNTSCTFFIETVVPIGYLSRIWRSQIH